MIAGTVCDHAALRLLITELEDSVARATKLEGANFLKVLTLEKQGSLGKPIQGCARHHGCAMGPRGDSLRGFAHVAKGNGVGDGGAHVTSCPGRFGISLYYCTSNFTGIEQRSQDLHDFPCAAKCRVRYDACTTCSRPSSAGTRQKRRARGFHLIFGSNDLELGKCTYAFHVIQASSDRKALSRKAGHRARFANPRPLGDSPDAQTVAAFLRRIAHHQRPAIPAQVES